MTDTRPPALSDPRVQDEIRFRVEMLTHNARVDEWMKAHDKRDDERFQRQDEKLSALEGRVVIVTSEAADTNSKKQQIVGAWKLATLIGVAAVAGGGFVLALLTYLHEVAK